MRLMEDSNRKQTQQIKEKYFYHFNKNNQKIIINQKNQLKNRLENQNQQEMHQH